MARASQTESFFGTAESLDQHLETFLEALASQGYKERTRQGKKRTLERFVNWVRHIKGVPCDLNECVIAAYLKGERGPRRCGGRPEPVALHQFLAHLRTVGATPVLSGPEQPCSADVLVGNFVDYLRQSRGLSPHSVAVYTPFVRGFVASLDFDSREGLAACVNASVIRGHLLKRSRGRSSEYTRLLATALRSFLRFLFLVGEVPRDLATAVPPVRRWQLAAVPALLVPDEVEKVLAAIDRTTVRGRRALAMLLLLARLGLRPGEVARLELDDLHWSTSELIVPGKGKIRDRLPLPEDVGEALALYLRHARGTSTSRRVFLRVIAPRVGLAGPCAVCAVARSALRHAGLHLPGRVAAHIFRHSLATRMIRHGASLEEIAQVLRHRNVITTQLYAKVDFEALRRVARPWPVAAGGDQ